LRQVILACGFGEESVVADAARSRSGTGQDPSVGGAERTALTSCQDPGGQLHGERTGV
jgi:hypothetical protein